MKKLLFVALGLGLGILLDQRNKKKLISPVKPLKVVSKFGKRLDPFNHSVTEFHNGIDIIAPTGTPVKAVSSGLVHTWYDDLNGFALKIKAKNGFTYGYAHLSKIMVRDLVNVKSGQIIALAGSTGKATGSHLHFTVTDPGGNKVDPLKYISA